MRLGDRITLARLATPPLLPSLLADSEPRVAEAALLNGRLREEDLVTALRREDLRPALIAAVDESPRWRQTYEDERAVVFVRAEPGAASPTR